MNPDTDNQDAAGEKVVCPKCLLSNSPDAAFCADCGAPIGMVATVDPIQQIHAEGFGYRSAVDGPPKLIIVIGVWLIFGPTLLVGFFLPFNRVGAGMAGSVVYALMTLVSGIIIFRTTKNYVVKSRAAQRRNE